MAIGSGGAFAQAAARASAAPSGSASRLRNGIVGQPGTSIQVKPHAHGAGTAAYAAPPAPAVTRQEEYGVRKQGITDMKEKLG